MAKNHNMYGIQYIVIKTCNKT